MNKSLAKCLVLISNFKHFHVTYFLYCLRDILRTCSIEAYTEAAMIISVAMNKTEK